MPAIAHQKYNLIRQTRGYRFLGLLAAAVFLGFLCVPGATDGYEIFYMGGVRGIYNSAWLGAMAACLPVILLWLPGFYLLRSQVSEDRRLKIGQIIAATPISRLRYISGKVFGNFLVLMSLDILFTAAVVVMQLIRGEVMRINLAGYLEPLLFITVPHMMVLAALTVFFDVMPGMGGAFGNILIFMIWVSLTTLSVAIPGNAMDLFSMGFILDQMLVGARTVFPSLPDAASFGYYKVQGNISTFHWSGISWDTGFLASRLLWIGVALLLVVLSAVLFDRFRSTRKLKEGKSYRLVKEAKSHTSAGMSRAGRLSPVKHAAGINLPGLVRGELIIALSGHSAWWYLSVFACIVLSAFTTSGEGEKWIALIMLLPMAVWSQMGCREKQYSTTDMILSSCSLSVKWMAAWISGILISLLMSSGMILRFYLHGNAAGLIAWIAGAVFVPSLALTLGSLCGNRKAFEGLYIALFYFGPINGMPGLDFFGLVEHNTMLYLMLTTALVAAGYTVQAMKEKRILLTH